MARGVKNPGKPSGGYNSPGGAILHGVMDALGLGNAWNKLSGDGLTEAEIANMQFNADEAEKTRIFNASEAQKQRDWEQMMTEQRYQFTTSDMAASGLNPAMMYGGGQSPASVPSGAAASGSAASSSAGATASGGLIDTILRAFLTTAQANNLKKQGDMFGAEADLARQNSQYVGMQTAWYPALSDATIRKVNSEIRGNDSNVDLNEAKAAHERVLTAIDQIEEKWRDKILEAKKTLMSDQSYEAKANAAAAFARAYVDNLEGNYMKMNNARMGSSEFVTVAEYILSALGINDDGSDNGTDGNGKPKGLFRTVMDEIRKANDKVLDTDGDGTRDMSASDFILDHSNSASILNRGNKATRKR